MRAIFISYRREDTEGQAGRLFDDLVKFFGEQSVFMDVAGIEPGRDFRKAIDEHVASCGVLLALIGKNWIDARDEAGRRRLDDPLDFVRLETAAALKRDIPVVPVLVRGASMPRADQLPTDLENLVFRNAIELTHARWDSDVAVLCKALGRLITLSQPDTADRGSIERGIQTVSKPPEPAPPRRVSLRAIGLVVIMAILLTSAVGWWVISRKQEAAQQAAEAQREAAQQAAEKTRRDEARQVVPGDDPKIPSRTLSEMKMDTPQAPNCSSDSDEKVVLPIKLMFEAINTRNIQLLESQLRDNATFGTIGKKEGNKSDFIAAWRKVFSSAKQLRFSDEKFVVTSRNADHAKVRVTSSSIMQYSGSPVQKSNVIEWYDVICEATEHWRIEENIYSIADK